MYNATALKYADGAPIALADTAPFVGSIGTNFYTDAAPDASSKYFFSSNLGAHSKPV